MNILHYFGDDALFLSDTVDTTAAAMVLAVSHSGVVNLKGALLFLTVAYLNQTERIPPAQRIVCVLHQGVLTLKSINNHSY
ncbi:hypothetical protein ACVBEF_00640 [Glaciimonas sp. GG7]